MDSTVFLFLVYNCLDFVVQSLSHVWLFETSWTAVRQASLSFNISWSLLTHVHWVGATIKPSHPLSSPSLSAVNFPSFRVFSSEPALSIRWPKCWSFSFSISPSDEYSGLISFRIYWFDLFSVQGTLKSLLQHHNSKASILQCSAFFTVQFSHLYTTTGKTIYLTMQTSVGKIMSLLLNRPTRFVIAFLPRSKHLLISWLQSPSAMILELKKITSVTVSIFAMKWWDWMRWS